MKQLYYHILTLKINPNLFKNMIRQEHSPTFSEWVQIMWNGSKTKPYSAKDIVKCKMQGPIQFSVSNIDLKVGELKISSTTIIKNSDFTKFSIFLHQRYQQFINGNWLSFIKNTICLLFKKIGGRCQKGLLQKNVNQLLCLV